ncbi:MAG: hypothetical protein RLY31_1714 [Bacteroidota bacterium]
MRRFRLFSVLLFAILFCSPHLSYSQCVMVCNDLVNVSLPETGQALVEADILLESGSGACPGPKTVTVFGPSGQSLGDLVGCDWVGQVLFVLVVDEATQAACWGNIRVEDHLPPVVQCQDTAIYCTTDPDPAVLSLYQVADNCDAAPLVNHTSQWLPAGCGDSLLGSFSRTWQAFDAAGNSSAVCVQTVSILRPTLQDVVFPISLDGVHAPALACGATDLSPAVTGYPSIGGQPVASMCGLNVQYEDETLPGCGETYAVLRRWIVLDWCSGALIQTVQLIRISDDVPPTVSCPDTIVVSTNGPGCTATFLLPSCAAEDACGGVVNIRTLLPGLLLPSNGGLLTAWPAGSYEVNYLATDACQNTGVCNSYLQVRDEQPPVAVCDGAMVVSLGTLGYSEVSAALFDDGSEDDCCAVAFSGRRMDDTTGLFGAFLQFDCADLQDTVPVVIRVSDCGGNVNTCMSLVTVQDKLPPSIQCPAHATVPCESPQPVPPSLAGMPLAADNCTVDTLFFEDQSDLNLCLSGTVLRTFTVRDITGYEASCQQTITRVDLTPSQFLFPPDTIADCSVALDSLDAGAVTIWSDCEMFAVSRSDEVYAQDCGAKVYRTHTVQDWCTGWDTSYTQEITVQDLSPPVWSEAPGALDRVFLCEGDFVKPPPPEATDYCSSFTVELTGDTTIAGDCPNRFTRMLRFSAVDSCGNMAAPYLVTLVVNDTLPPTADPFLSAGPYACPGEVPAPSVSDVIAPHDNCIGAVTVEFVEESAAPACAGTLQRIFRLTDECDNSVLLVQDILVQDTVAPTASPMPVLGPFSCVEEIPAPNMSNVIGETDNCQGPVTVEHAGDTGLSACSGTVIRTYRLTDACGNQRLLPQTILVEDQVPPVMSWSDSLNIIVSGLGCTAFVSVNASAQDNCPANPVTLVNDYNGGGGNASGDYPIGETVVTFTATDACGNSAQVQTSVIVKELTPPTASCPSFEVSLDASGLAEVPVDSLVAAGFLVAEDACTDVTVDFQPSVMDCGFLLSNPTMVTYTMVVTDTFGNSATCEGDLLLFDPTNACTNSTPLVAGLVYRQNFQGMANVQVRLQEGNVLTSTYTAGNGLYQFDQVPASGGSMVSPYKNDELLSGVTTFDLVLLTRHVLGVDTLDSPYKIIAADANRSGAVTTYDAVVLRKAILFLADEFPGNTAWRFVRADYQFLDPMNPLEESFPEVVQVSGAASDMAGRSFVAVKVGDLNGSTAGNLRDEDLVLRQAGTGAQLLLQTTDRRLTAGETVRWPLVAGSDATLSAWQFCLQHDITTLRFRSAEGCGLAGFSSEQVSVPEAGMVGLAWDHAGGQQVQAGDTLLVLEMEVLETSTLASSVRLGTGKIPAVAYTPDGYPLNIGWRIHAAEAPRVDAARLFALGQPFPNPFRETASVPYELGEGMDTRWEWTDQAGRTEVLQAGWTPAGSHVLRLPVPADSPPGVYFLQLVTPYGREAVRLVRR